MLESTSSFATLTLPSYSPASWSRIGAMMRHGPHQVAQKSTTARPSCFSISCSNVASVTATAFDMLVSPPPSGVRAALSIGASQLACRHYPNPAFHNQLVPNPNRPGARVAHIGIAVASLDALLPFYRDVLGMDV